MAFYGASNGGMVAVTCRTKTCDAGKNHVNYLDFGGIPPVQTPVTRTSSTGKIQGRSDC